MNPSRFQEQNEERWTQLERVLERVERNVATEEDASKLPGLFRQACSDLSLAQYRMYGLSLCERINKLVIRGYQDIQQGSAETARMVAHGIWAGVPRAVRAEWRLFLLCMLLFWGPYLLMTFSIHSDMRWVQSLLGPEQMQQLEMGFGKGAKISDFREGFGSNFAMFGHYIENNVGIDFQIFAGGLLAGIGTIFFLVLNGLLIGASTGYVIKECDPMNFLNWVSGHAWFELMGMILCGMAGLRLGMAIVHPGRRSRRQALEYAGKRAGVLVLGGAGMTTIAAFIEGFWSPLDVEPMLKYAFGLATIFLIMFYLLFAGSGRARREA